MKLNLTTTLAATIGLSSTAASRSTSTIKSNTPLGQKLLSSARRLDDANQQFDYTWVANYSLKFQGCHTTPQWNEDGGNNNYDDSSNIKLVNLNLVRFRLCPSDTCATDTAYGCKSGYGDYVVSMDVYLQAYLDSVQQDQEYNCEYARSNECGCYNNGDDYGTFEKCEYDCFMNKGMEYCVDNNPYADDGQYQAEDDDWDLTDMVQCQQFGQLNGVQYYSGAYCSSDGGSIVMGVFTDGTCSNLADVYGGQELYMTIAGKELPHAQTTLIGNECMSCMEGADANYNDQQDADAVKEGCETLYLQAGKCEQTLNGGGSGNNKACKFMEGIDMVYKEGGIFHKSHSSSAAGVFIGVFSCSFFLLSTYAYYLKSKLDRAKVQLADDL
eukprot:scaffold1709_cov151-Skeletonema_menzelii.AAC.8